jgi:hypothetical protein
VKLFYDVNLIELCTTNMPNNRVSSIFEEDIDTKILGIFDFDLFHIECLLFKKNILTHIYFNNKLIPKVIDLLKQKEMK